MKTWRPLRYRGLWWSFGIYFVWFHSIKRFHAFFLHPRAIIEPFFIFLDKRQITKFVKCINTKFQTSVEFQKSCMMSNCLILQDLIVHLLISWEISHVQIYHITSCNQVVTVEWRNFNHCKMSRSLRSKL